MEVLPKQIRAARAFLYNRGITADQVPPSRFAKAAAELNVSFSQLVQLLGLALSGGQGTAHLRRQYLESEERKLQGAV